MNILKSGRTLYWGLKLKIRKKYYALYELYNRLSALFYPVLSNVKSPHKSFFESQYVAHGRYESELYPNNSLCLYKHLIKEGFKIVECDIMFTKDNIPILCHDDNLKNFAKDDAGTPVKELINTLTYSQISKYNFSKDDRSFIKVTTLDELLSLCSKNDICIELDLEKKYLGRKKYKILYDIVNRYNMLNRVIWEVSPFDFYSLASIDNTLIYQIDHTWSKKAIDELCKRKDISSLIISSEWFPGYVDRDYSEIIAYGKSKGLIMKCATINDEKEASKMLTQGVNLITTDNLK